MRAARCGGVRRTKLRPRARSTRGWASNAACGTRSSWRTSRERKHRHARSQDQRAHCSPAICGQRTFDEVASEYPDIATAYNHVDAACIYFVQDPHRYDVIVTDNLFGDILTDLGGAVSGGIGLASSANLNPARTGPSMFEPVHGSAPDIVGTGTANPTAAILSAALMLDFLGEDDAADRIRKACADPVSGSTTSVGDEIAARVRE